MLDFEGISSNLTFSAGAPGQRQCREISIFDDQALEPTETFRVLLMSSELIVGIFPNIATVSIEDNDCKT